MIITADAEYSTDYPVEQWSNQKYSFYWSGFLYWPNIESGEPSIRKFASELNTSNLDKASRFLRGTFWIAIRSIQSDEIWSFTDYSGMFQAFYSEKALSPDYRSLLTHTDERTLSNFALLSFLNLGNIYFDQSHTPSIHKIPGPKIVHLTSDFATKFISRKTPLFSFTGDAFQDFVQFFSEAAPALKNHNVITDLTGGSDSRLIASFMKYLDIPLNATVFGHKTDIDVKISSRVARQLNCDLNIVEPDYAMETNRIQKLFNLSDSLCDLLSLAGLQQVAESKKKSGGTLSINGGGGALYKDFWWLQDFPFYRRSKSNLEKLYSWRWNHQSFPRELLQDTLAKRQKKFRHQFLEKLAPYDAGMNTKTYDAIFMRVKMHEIVGRSNTSENLILPAYSPLLEYIPAKIGFNTPRLHRWYNYLERSLATQLAPEVSILPTTNGGNSLSNKPQHLIKDFPGYLSSKSARLFHKFTGKQAPAKQDRLTKFGERLKKSPVFNDAFSVLKSKNIIADDISTEQIPVALAGRVFTLGRIINEIKNTGK